MKAIDYEFSSRAYKKVWEAIHILDSINDVRLLGHQYTKVCGMIDILLSMSVIEECHKLILLDGLNQANSLGLCRILGVGYNDEANRLNNG